VGLTGEVAYSSYFCNWNANKRSVALNLKTSAGRDLFLQLLPRFDVLVENFGPGVVERLSIDYDSLRKDHPGLIYATIKGFGATGPYAEFKSYDMVAQAAAAAFSVTGEADGPPLVPGPTTGDSGTGVQLAMAILAAYVQKLRTGQGQKIEISMQEAMTYFMRTRIAIGAQWGNAASPRNGNAQGLPPVAAYPCKPFGPNDWAFIMPITDGHFDELCIATGMPELVADERFQGRENRIANGEALYQAFTDWTHRHTKHEVMTILGKAGVPCSACLDTKELHHDPHLVARGFVKHIEHPVHGKVPVMGFAPQLSSSEVPIERAPLLGEHTDEILAGDLGVDAAALAELRAEGVLG
jgi:formyl-CoA transferase